MIYNLTDVRGIKCWGAHIGIKSLRRDLAIIFSETPADVAALYTRNVVISENIKLTREHLQNGKAQAIVVNSGNANACTGEQGQEGARAMAQTTSELLNIPKEYVVVGSTGVIGREFPTQKVVEGIKKNIPKLTNRKLAGSLAANAILTTDTFSKEGYQSFEINHVKINMAGIAKGSGMIHPDMGTMLAYICCDISIDPELLNKAFKESVDKSFNMITVDGDTSTNDMAVIMCNGLAQNERIVSEEDPDYKMFKFKLDDLCLHLARLIVSDGEGVTKHIEYRVINAPDVESARKIIRTVSDSSLVKTAIYGRDPNWGRIIAAAGRAGVNFDPEKINLYVGDKDPVPLLEAGRPVTKNLSSLKRKMRATSICFILDLNMGKASATGWGTDLTEEYVKFNSAYTT